LSLEPFYLEFLHRVKLEFFFYLHDALLERFVDQNLEDRLHFCIEYEELAILDLRRYVDARLLWLILLCWRLR